jgi:hypothetical protein
VLADIELDSALTSDTAHVAVGCHGVLFLFALGETATWRLLATRRDLGSPPRCGQPGPTVPSAELQRLLDKAGLAAHIKQVNWSSRVRVQHRLAARYRRRSVFLAGDAAHVNSPAGGQGMNTGIQDAVNLGWKLARAPSSANPGALLESYEAERRPAARRVRALTDVLFWAESATGPTPSLLRGTVGPAVAPALPWLLGRPRVLAGGFRLVSRLDAGYGRVPRLARRWRQAEVGARLPDAPVVCAGRAVRLHELTAQPGFHVLAGPGALPDELDFGPLVHVHRLARVPGRSLVGVRPDGHIGFHGRIGDVAGLREWLARTGGCCGVQRLRVGVTDRRSG